jgi:hypothetical protein
VVTGLLTRPVVPLALAGMLAVPGLVLSRIYGGDLLPRLLLVAAVASVLISLFMRRMPSWSAAPVSVLGLFAMAIVSVKLSAASGGVGGALPDLTRDALRNGIPRLLTALIPIEPQPDTVIVPVIATWLAGLASAELALRYQRVMVSYVMPTLLLGGALYLVGPNARPVLWLPLAFAGLAALGLAASTREAGEPALTAQQRTTLRVRVGAGAAVALAIIVALGTALGPSVAGQVDNTPTDPRRYVTPPQLDSLDESPLARLSGWALNPDQHLLDADIESTGGVAETRIRLAVCSDYDGVTWRVGATYKSAGRVLTGPPAEQQAHPGGSEREVTQKITVDQLDGRLLPGVATPERIEGVRIAYDSTTGTMALPDGLRSGLGYTVVSKESKPDPNALTIAEVPSGPAVTRYVELSGTVPTQITELAQQLGSGVSNPYQRAQAVEQFLSEHYALVSDAPSGHAYPNLTYFLFGPRNAGGQKGTTEQFSAAFAVLARSLGLPTRIAVGFQVKGGRNRVKGADALAWPEVLFDGLGWVDFNPLPQPNTAPRPVEEDFRPKPDPTQSPPPPVEVSDSASPSARPSPSSSAATGPRSGATAGQIAAIAGGSVGGLLVLLGLTVVILRGRLRRSRLSTGTPDERITGAWLELLDGLRLAGRPVLPHLAAAEVVGFAASAAYKRGHSQRTGLRPPAPPIDDLASFANAVGFAPPGTATEAQAQRATAQAAAYIQELKSRRPWWRRLLWTVDPRPLLWKR